MDKKPTTNPVQQRKNGGTTYQLFECGELWTAGEYGYHCGYVSNPENIDYAIDVHEEEMRVIMAQAQEEVLFCD